MGVRLAEIFYLKNHRHQAAHRTGIQQRQPQGILGSWSPVLHLLKLLQVELGLRNKRYRQKILVRAERNCSQLCSLYFDLMRITYLLFHLGLDGFGFFNFPNGAVIFGPLS